MNHKEYIIPIGEEAQDYDEMFIGVIRRQPELVRCKDCKYYFKDAKPYPICGLTECHEDENDFCSSGERGKKNEPEKEIQRVAI